MILNYKFKNFLSFRENVEFSMEAPRTKVKKRFHNNYVETNQQYDILKTAVIVGENAGGKSNFVRSLEYFQSFFNNNEKVGASKWSVNSNNSIEKCPKKCETHQAFEIEVLYEDQFVYLYQLEIDAWGIVREVLSYKNKRSEKYKLLMYANRDVYKLDCDKEHIECKELNCNTSGKVGYKLSIPSIEQSMEKSLKETVEKQIGISLFITKLAILGNDHAMMFSEWMREKLCPETYYINVDVYKALKNEEEDLRIMREPKFIDIFKMVDSSIIEIEIDEDKPFRKTQVIRKNQNGIKFRRELRNESSGVSEFFAWAVQVFKVVYENKVVFADEMDRVLNPVLSDRVISFINGKQHYGQLIFTTHNVLHLDLKNYMKEQIYFITKNTENLESEMYSLADFPEIRYETTKIYEFYLKGILGGTANE